MRDHCNLCGSSSIRADRALSGRLVCNSCGEPLDSNSNLFKAPLLINNSKLKSKLLIITLLVALVIIFMR